MTHISVIIPTCNRPHYLNRTLSSLMSQELDPSLIYEVLVLDDYCRDRRTSEIANYWAGKRNVRYLRREDYGSKGGRTRIRNLGISQAKGDLLIFLDDDMIVRPNLIQQHWNSHARSDRNIVLGYRYYLKLSQRFLEYINPVSIIGQPDVLDHLPWVRDERETVYKSCGGDLMRLSAPWVLLFSNNCSVRRKFLLDLGKGFSEEFEGAWGGEDVELGFRLYKAGGRFILNREAAGYHQWHYANWRKNIESLRVNLRRLYELHPSLETELYLDHLDIGLEAYLADLKKLTNLNGHYPVSLLDGCRSSSYVIERLGLKHNDKVLIIGAGNGLFVSRIKPSVCADFRRSAIESLKRMSPQTAGARMLGSHLPYPDRHFDIVIINDFLETIPSYQRRLIFREALRLGRRLAFATSARKLRLLSGQNRQLSISQISAERAFRAVAGFKDDPSISISVHEFEGYGIFIVRPAKESLPSIQSLPCLSVVADANLRDSFSDNAIELILALSEKGCDTSLQLEDYKLARLVWKKRLPNWDRYGSKEQSTLIAALHRDLRGERKSFPELTLTERFHHFDRRVEWLRNKTVGVMSSPIVNFLNEQVDAVWCPGRITKDYFLKSGGLADRAHIVPVGVSKRLIQRIGMQEKKASRIFRFLCIGTIERSDGIDIAIEAFCKGFARLKDTELTVRILSLSTSDFINNHGSHNATARTEYRKHVEQAHALQRYRLAQWRQLVKRAGMAERVKFEPITDGLRSWPNFFSSADCYLQSHRVDPVGQRVIQAMGLGIPVIATGRYLPDHLKLPGSAYLVHSGKVTAADAEWSSDVVYACWAEPNLAHLMRLMRHVYSNRREAIFRAERSRAYVLENLTWDKVAELVVENLGGQKTSGMSIGKASSELARLFSDLRDKQLITIEEAAYEQK